MNIYVDTDNGLGSPRGDVDDGFALAALLRHSSKVKAIASVWGNTTSERSFRNNINLGKRFNYTGSYLHGAESKFHTHNQASQYLAQYRKPLTILAMGPLTNLAAAMEEPLFDNDQIIDVVIVGGNSSSLGKWPPVWPYEFNLTKDKRATHRVFHSSLPLTIIPLNVARRLTLNYTKWCRLTGPGGDYLKKNSWRWLRRNLILKGCLRFPLWDLLAVAYVLCPQWLTFIDTVAQLNRWGHLNFGNGARPVRLICDFEKDPVLDWAFF